MTPGKSFIPDDSMRLRHRLYHLKAGGHSGTHPQGLSRPRVSDHRWKPRTVTKPLVKKGVPGGRLRDSPKPDDLGGTSASALGLVGGRQG